MKPEPEPEVFTLNYEDMEQSHNSIPDRHGLQFPMSFLPQKGIDKKFSESLKAIPAFVQIDRTYDSLAPAVSGIALQHLPPVKR